ncbi:polysaccharide deacetylase family protein [Luteitalea pratensis]|uniref:polysaccharide deacetylase family protein n=1 Tax=Luteitalea pratensis TaxID=1855912 RepID=UPI0012FFCED7|nr:polysaccharide deacetylase family protein [Luteitalea pratensis]
MIHRARNKWRRYAIEHWGGQHFLLDAPHAYVSFTFDDFPRTAYTVGGRILREHGVRGTYFVSSALLGGPSPSGAIATAAEVAQVVEDGHEIGCHTREHLDGTRATPEAFERSIRANNDALAEVIPGMELDVFAFPLEGPTLQVKRAVGPHFRASRGGGQTFNAGRIDLHLLKSFFLDYKTRDDMDAIKRVIDESAARRGWLIFSTHDVDPTPSAYGCTPATFERVVALACQSGARVLPMGHVCAELGIAR